MEEEWNRGISWTNWKGTEYSDRAEWNYVMSDAKEDPTATSGTGLKEKGHTGMSVDDFVSRMGQRGVALTKDEVLSCRLYTGNAHTHHTSRIAHTGSHTHTLTHILTHQRKGNEQLPDNETTDEQELMMTLRPGLPKAKQRFHARARWGRRPILAFPPRAGNRSSSSGR